LAAEGGGPKRVYLLALAVELGMGFINGVGVIVIPEGGF
jgi:hypothetical protein